MRVVSVNRILTVLLLFPLTYRYGRNPHSHGTGRSGRKILRRFCCVWAVLFFICCFIYVLYTYVFEETSKVFIALSPPSDIISLVSFCSN